MKLPRQTKDLHGQKFGKLTVMEYAGNKPRVMWRCKCDCGKETVVRASVLANGHTRSCGCVAGTLFKRSHGMRRTPTYESWCHMKGRCNNPKDQDFPHYGGRGIKVCDRWQSFDSFLADMGPMPDGYSIERVDTDGNYEPANCKWIAKKEQPRNTRRSRYVIVEGERMIYSDAARKLGVSSSLVSAWAHGIRSVPASLNISFAS